MLFNPDTNTYTDLKDGQLLAKSDKMENEVKSVFEDLYVVELEKEKTLVIKKITNEACSDETKARGTFFLEERNRDKKGITLTKSDCGKIAIMLKEISEK